VGDKWKETLGNLSDCQTEVVLTIKPGIDRPA
jgi:hypothetical protein